jgi:ANTAR domain
MLMLIYGMDDSAAFELLKWRSQETNTKLRLLARQVAADFVALSSSEVPRSVRLRQRAIDRAPADQSGYRNGERYGPIAIRRHRIASRTLLAFKPCWASWCKQLTGVDHLPT